MKKESAKKYDHKEKIPKENGMEILEKEVYLEKDDFWFGEITHIYGYPIDLTYRIILKVMSEQFIFLKKKEYDFIIELSQIMSMINKYIKHDKHTPLERQENLTRKWLSLINWFEMKYGTIQDNIEKEINILRTQLAHTEDVSERKELEKRLTMWLSAKIQIR